MYQIREIQTGCLRHPIMYQSNGRDLERIARIRAVEGGLCFGFVGSGHNRLNGKGLSTVKYNGVSTYAEVLAYNWNKGNLVSGINQWYDEKSDWVKQTSDAVTGHYTSMIDPRNTYVGLGIFIQLPLVIRIR